MTYSNEIYKILAQKTIYGSVVSDFLIIAVFGVAIITVVGYGFKFITEVLYFYNIGDYIEEVMTKLAGRIGGQAVNFLGIAFIIILLIYFLRWLLSWLSESGTPVKD